MWFFDEIIWLCLCDYWIVIDCCGLSVESESVWVSGLSLSQSDEMFENMRMCDGHVCSTNVTCVIWWWYDSGHDMCLGSVFLFDTWKSTSLVGWPLEQTSLVGWLDYPGLKSLAGLITPEKYLFGGVTGMEKYLFGGVTVGKVPLWWGDLWNILERSW